MEVLAVLLVLGIFFFPFISVVILWKKVRSLEDQNADLRFRMEALEKGQPSGADFPESEKTLAEETLTGTSADEAQTPPTVSPPPVSPLPVFTPEKKKRKSGSFGRLRKSAFWQKAEHQFLENWSGILGSVIMVLGAGFLSIYAALKFNEFVRFLLLLLLAAVPGALYYLLRNKEKWQLQALWMRSISGAVFLFACLGSGGVPGLQWVHNPIWSLGLLILGIAVNLGLSSLGKRQEFASFHCLLSLVALAVMPPGASSLVIALIITLYALIHCYRQRWDIHLLLVLTGFFAYHIYWIFSLDTYPADDLRLLGAAALSLIFLTSTFVHYRKAYTGPRFSLLPFLGHLLNWLYFAVGMYLYVGERPERSLVILAGSLLAFVLTGQAERKKIPWLRSTGLVMGELLLVSAVVTLKGWDVSTVMIAGIIYAQALLFLQMMIRVGQKGLYRFALCVHAAAALTLIYLFFEEQGLNSLIYSAGLTAALGAHHLGLSSRKDSSWLSSDFPFKLKREFSITGLLCGIAAFTLLIMISEELIRFEYLLGAALPLPLLILRRKSDSRGLRAGLVLFLSSYLIGSSDHILNSLTGFPEQAVLFAGLFLTAGATFFWENKTSRSMLISGLILSAAGLMLLSFKVLEPLSPFAPGLAWLVFYVLIMRVKKIPGRFTPAGLLFIAAFLIRHFTVLMDLDNAWGPLLHRHLSELALLAAFYLGRRKTSVPLEDAREAGEPKMMEKIRSFSMDAGVLLFLLFTALELPFVRIPAALSLACLGMLGYRHFIRKEGRILGYALLFYGLSMILLSLALIGGESGLRLAGLMTLAALSPSLYMVINLEDLSEIGRPIFFKRLEKAKAPLLLYSLALTTALYLYRAVPSDYLTMLWALECFLIFSAGIFLTGKHFRYAAQGGLVLCVIRLILIDLDGSGPLLRGAVFLAVGLLMLGTNSLYNRFRERFSPESSESSEKQDFL